LSSAASLFYPEKEADFKTNHALQNLMDYLPLNQAAALAKYETAGTDGSSTDGSLTDGSLTDGSPTDGSLTDGSLTDGSPIKDSPTSGSGGPTNYHFNLINVNVNKGGHGGHGDRGGNQNGGNDQTTNLLSIPSSLAPWLTYVTAAINALASMFGNMKTK